ncbi:60S ribosomal protein L29 [Camelus dromedarius]|uniref:60S ribosomal protein L29 n=1 Tax=Camelus dromedarius TaxID=9838 RepID=A0A5N4CCU9_CAMDR|nr:60S ribosomal protein L29 [Camelus dromedarius]
MRFAKKHNKKGLKKMQANNAKATSARAEAIKALKGQGAASSVNLPTLLTPSSGNMLVPAAGLRAKAKAQTKAAAPAPAQASKGAQAPQRLQRSGLHLLMRGQKDWCDPWAAVCMGLISHPAPGLPLHLCLRAHPASCLGLSTSGL